LAGDAKSSHTAGCFLPRRQKNRKPAQPYLSVGIRVQIQRPAAALKPQIKTGSTYPRSILCRPVSRTDILGGNSRHNAATFRVIAYRAVCKCRETGEPARFRRHVQYITPTDLKMQVFFKDFFQRITVSAFQWVLYLYGRYVSRPFFFLTGRFMLNLIANNLMAKMSKQQIYKETVS
jgi:hypothetical protein